jgi:MFS family permease
MSIRSHRDFVRIWSGQAVSNLGDGVHRIAVLWWAKQATGSNLVVVIVALASVVPALIAAPFAGWLVDHTDRRRLMLAGDAVRIATSAALAILASTHSLSTTMVVMCASVAAAATCVFSTAYTASITMLVASDDRARANSMVGINEALAGIVGPALGGLLIGLWGTSSALTFDAATFAVSLVVVAVSRVPMPEASAATQSADTDEGFAAGLALVRKNRSLRDLVVVAAGLNMFVSPVPVLLVALAAGPFALGGTGYGLLEACIPAGLLVGFVVGPRCARFRWSAVIALAVTGAGIALAGVTSVAVVGGLTLLAGGVGIGVANTVLPTRFQRDVEPAVQGRVFALLGALGQAGRPLGLLLTAPLIALVGVRGGLAVCGVLMLLITWLGRHGLEERGGQASLGTAMSHLDAEPVH